MSAINNDILSRVTASETAYADSVANNLANTPFAFSNYLQAAETQTSEEAPTASPANDAEPGETWGYQPQVPSGAALQTSYGTTASQPATDAAPQSASAEQTDQPQTDQSQTDQPQPSAAPQASEAANQPPANPRSPASSTSGNASPSQPQGATQGTSPQEDSTSSPAANQDVETASQGNPHGGKRGSNGAASTAGANSSSATASDGNSQKAKNDDPSAVVVDISAAAAAAANASPAGTLYSGPAGAAVGNWKAGPPTRSGGIKGRAAAGEAAANRSQSTSHATSSASSADSATATAAAQTAAQTTASATAANNPASPPAGQTAVSTTASDSPGAAAATSAGSSTTAQDATAADALANAAADHEYMAPAAGAPSNTSTSPATEVRSWPTPGMQAAALDGIRTATDGQPTQSTVSDAVNGDIESAFAPESQADAQAPAAAFSAALSQSNSAASTGTTTAKPDTAASSPTTATAQIAGQTAAPAGGDSGTAPASDTNLSQTDRVRFVQRVEQAFQGLSTEGGSIRLRLSPPDLGSLRIEISVVKGAMTARVEAETPAARNILLDNLPALRDRLAQQDIKVQRFDVDLMDRSNNGMSYNQSSQQQNSARQNSSSAAVRSGVRSSDGTTATAESTATRPVNGGGRLNVVV